MLLIQYVLLLKINKMLIAERPRCGVRYNFRQK